MNGENVLKEWNGMGCPKAALIVLTKSDRWDIVYNLFTFEHFYLVKECFLFTEEEGHWNMLYFDEKGKSTSDYYTEDGFRIEVLNDQLCGYLGNQTLGKYPLSFDTLEDSFQNIREDIYLKRHM